MPIRKYVPMTAPVSAPVAGASPTCPDRFWAPFPRAATGERPVFGANWPFDGSRNYPFGWTCVMDGFGAAFLDCGRPRRRRIPSNAAGLRDPAPAQPALGFPNAFQPVDRRDERTERRAQGRVRKISVGAREGGHPPAEPELEKRNRLAKLLRERLTADDHGSSPRIDPREVPRSVTLLLAPGDRRPVQGFVRHASRVTTRPAHAVRVHRAAVDQQHQSRDRLAVVLREEHPYAVDGA